MRKPTNTASLARLVAALFAAPVIAHAMPASIVTHSFGMSSASTSSASTSTTAPTTLTSPAPSSSSGTTSGSSPGTVIAPTNTTKVDQRNAQTNDATQANRASGNTAASQIVSAASGGATTQGSSGSSTVNSSTGTTTTGSAGSTGGTGTGGTTGTGVTSVGSNGLLGGMGVVVNSGEPTVDANGNFIAPSAPAQSSSANVSYAAASQYAVPANGTLGADVVVADNTMNQVIGTAKRDRKRVGRNGQLLYSIAPRTNVDRTAQMRDDGPSPALTGPLAR